MSDQRLDDSAVLAEDRRGRDARRWVLIAVALGLLAGAITWLGGFDPPAADIKYDWLAAWGAINSNAHADVLQLANDAGVDVHVNAPPGVEPPFPHPRTPAAVLLSVPLLLIDYDVLFAFSAGVSVGLVALLAAWATDGVPVAHRLLLIVVIGFSAPVWVTIRFASQAALVAVLVTIAWRERHREATSGGLIAIAGVLKVFPLVLFAPLLLGRKTKAVLVGAATLIGLNLFGLLLPGINLEDTRLALQGASTRWIDLIGNGSGARLLADVGLDATTAIALLGFAGTLYLTLLYRRRGRLVLRDPMPWLLVALVVLPISWISYDLVILGAVIVMLVANRSTPRYLGFAVAGTWVTLVVGSVLGIVDFGYWGLAVRAVLLGAAWFGLVTWDREARRWVAA